MMTELDLIFTKFSEVFSRLDKIESMISPKEDIIGIEEASKFTGYSKGTIYNMARRCDIPFYKRGAKLVFSRKALGEWMLEKPVKTRHRINQQAAAYVALNR